MCHFNCQTKSKKKLRARETDLQFPVKEDYSSVFSFSVSCNAAWGVLPFYTLSQPAVAINNIVILSSCKHANPGTRLDDSVNSINVCYYRHNSFSLEAKTRGNRN